MSTQGGRLSVGFLSTAKINDLLLDGARQSDEVEVVAVASRDPARATAYARERGIERAYGSYEELLADPSSTPSTSRCRTRCTTNGRWRR